MFGRKAKKIKILECQIADLKEDLDAWRDRFRMAGSDPRIDIAEGVESIEVKPLPFGMFLNMWGDWDELKAIEDAKLKVTERLVSSLINGDYVQFIVHPPEFGCPLNQLGTVAAKLRVVPWEKSTVLIRKGEQKNG